MKLDETLVNAAIEFVKKRFPNDVPWEGASAMYADDGTMLISTAPETVNDSVSLCHEAGAICEAYKLSKNIVATVCVSRDDKGNFVILTPCGVCQERLMYWGPNVQAAVPSESDPTKWVVKTLAEIQPYYWAKIFNS